MNTNQTILFLLETEKNINNIPHSKSREGSSVLNLIHRIEKAFPKSKYGIKFIISEDADVAKNSLQISGLFNAKNKYNWNIKYPKRAADIFITIHYNKINTNEIILTRAKHREFLLKLYSAISHEIIHRAQWSRIRSKEIPAEYCLWYKYYSSKCADRAKRDEQEYLGSYIEIDAYAHDFMLDLKRVAIDSQCSSLELLRRHKSLSMQDSVLDDYLNTFDYDYNHPAIKLLLRRTRFWIEKYNSIFTK